MRTALDTNVISAIWSAESTAQRAIERLEMARLDGALLISPAVFAELLAYPGASESFVAEFLSVTGISVDFRLEPSVWSETGRRFARYAQRRRQSVNKGPRRLVADFLIGAHALLQADRLFTLDPTPCFKPTDFSPWTPRSIRRISLKWFFTSSDLIRP